MLTAVTPVSPTSPGKDDLNIQAEGQDRYAWDEATELRIKLTTPSDKDSKLLEIALQHGPQGIIAVLRSRRDYGWFVILGLRAMEVCLGPRPEVPVDEVGIQLQDCDPIAFAMQMLEMEAIDEIFLLMKQYEHLREAQRSGLAIIEMLIEDDVEWRDEVARKGGVELLCGIAKQRKDNQGLMCQVMTCMAYLSAEDYVEIMLCQHDALEYVGYILRHYAKNAELVYRACLALLNMTCCESHVEELVDKDDAPQVLRVMCLHSEDQHVAMICCGILANLSVADEARSILVEEGVFQRIHDAMRLDSANAVLQVACLKALVNYSTDPNTYMKMEAIGIPNLVGQVMVDHGADPQIQKYGNFFLGQHSRCPMM